MFSTLRLHLSRLNVKQQAIGARDTETYVADVFRFYTRITRKLLDAERCSIFIFDPETQKVWLKAGTGVQERGIEVAVQGSIVGEVIESGKTVTREGLASREGVHQATDEQTGFVTRNILCVPILDPQLNEAVGAIEVLNKHGDQPFTAEDAEQLCELAEQIQTRVSRIYLGQEIFGLSEKIMRTASRVVAYSIMGAVVVVAMVALMMFLWVLVPAFQ